MNDDACRWCGHPDAEHDDDPADLFGGPELVDDEAACGACRRCHPNQDGRKAANDRYLAENVMPAIERITGQLPPDVLQQSVAALLRGRVRPEAVDRVMTTPAPALGGRSLLEVAQQDGLSAAATYAARMFRFGDLHA